MKLEGILKWGGNRQHVIKNLDLMDACVVFLVLLEKNIVFLIMTTFIARI